MQHQPQQPIGREEPQEAPPDGGHGAVAQQQPEQGVSPRRALPAGAGRCTQHAPLADAHRALPAGLLLPEPGLVSLEQVGGEPVQNGAGGAEEPGQHLKATGRESRRSVSEPVGRENGTQPHLEALEFITRGTKRLSVSCLYQGVSARGQGLHGPWANAVTATAVLVTVPPGNTDSSCRGGPESHFSIILSPQSPTVSASKKHPEALSRDLGRLWIPMLPTQLSVTGRDIFCALWRAALRELTRERHRCDSVPPVKPQQAPHRISGSFPAETRLWKATVEVASQVERQNLGLAQPSAGPVAVTGCDHHRTTSAITPCSP